MKYRPLFVTFFLLVYGQSLLSFWSPFDFMDTDSSKAQHSLQKAEALLQSPKEEEKYEGIHLLQALLQETSFPKLSAHTQAQTVFLLAKGYETIDRQNEELLLLQQQLKRSELKEYAYRIKAQIIRVLLLQRDVKEADSLLRELLTLSSKPLSSREKTALSEVLLARDDRLFSMIKEARQHLLQGKFQKASFLLEKVASSLFIEPIPCQASPLTKKQMTYSVLFSLAECYLFSGKNALATETIEVLLKEEALSPCMKEELLIMKSLAGGHFPEKEIAALSLKLPELKIASLLWTTRLALFQSKDFHELITDTIPPLLLHYLQALEALKNGNSSKACLLFQQHLAEALSSEYLFKKQYVEGFQEALYLRALLSYYMNREDLFNDALVKFDTLSTLIDELQIPSKKSAFLALSLMQRNAPLSKEALGLTHKETDLLSQTLRTLLESKEAPQQALSSLDQLFLHTVSLYIEASFPIPPPQFSEEDPHALAMLTKKVLQATVKTDELSPLLLSETFDEARPKILHTLLSQKIRTNAPKEEIISLIHLFLHFSSGYSRKKEAIFDYFLSMDTQAGLSQEEKQALLDELCLPPFDKWAPLVLIYLQESSQLNRYIYPTHFEPFLRVLQKLEQTHSYEKEAQKSQGSGTQTDLIRASLAGFKEVETEMKLYLKQPHTREELTVAVGLFLKMTSQWSDLLFSEMLSDHPFLDLENHLQQALLSLQVARDYLTLLKSQDPGALLPQAESESQDREAAGQIFLCTFREQYEGAVLRAQALPNDFVYSPTIRSILYLSQALRKRKNPSLAWQLLQRIKETEVKEINQELSLQVAIEKSLCLKEMGQMTQAMACLAWVINDSTASSLRIKAMVIRAELYVQMKRPELAMRQLETAQGKGGEWGQAAARKLLALQETWPKKTKKKRQKKVVVKS